MSLVVVPDLVESAATDLAGIRSTLAEASSAAAGPTTGIVAAAQDEVSSAIASLFGGYGKEFQALQAQAQAFHAEFENLLNAGAGNYLSTEIANAGQVLAGGASPAATSATGSLGAVLSEVAAPYEQLFTNTVTNLQGINSAFSANGFPVLRQILSNQVFYAEQIATGIGNLPTELANFPAFVQTGIAGFNPVADLQGFANQANVYGTTISTSLQAAGHDLATGLQSVPAGFQAAFTDLQAGDNVGAYGQLQQTLQNAFLPGFQGLSLDLGNTTPQQIPVVPLGPLGDLAPVLSIPGQIAQTFTNLLPAGSIPAHMAQNFTNLLNTFTNFGTTLNFPALTVDLGMPLTFVIDAIGAPAQALSALNSSASAFVGALQAGNTTGAFVAALDLPANVTNAFLNGQVPLITLPPTVATLTVGGVPLGTLPLSLQLPSGGLLSPLQDIPALPGGTQLGGLVPGLVNFGPELAQAIAVPGASAFSNLSSAVAAQAIAVPGASDISSFWSGVAAPYQSLVSTTEANLSAIGATISANPLPVLHQIVTNQIGYAHTIATGIQNLPTELANLPGNIQSAVQGFNPVADVQGFVTQANAYGTTISASLQAAGHDLSTGLQSVPAGFQAAFADLQAGDNVGAYGQLQQTLQNAFLPGFQDISLDLGAPATQVPVVPLGPLGDLAPVLTIPGQIAQSFTNLLPAGSIPAHMAQNFTNLLNTFTNFGTTIASDSLAVTFGTPLTFLFDAIGAPAQGLSALNSSALAFVTAAQAGNASAAATALLDMPANVTNAFLNGQAIPFGTNGLDIDALLNLPPVTANVLFDGTPIGSLSESVEVGVGGLLSPLGNLYLSGGGAVPGTQIGGLIPGLLSFGPELAADLTG